jgi:CRP/FNR family transcriptional regulator
MERPTFPEVPQYREYMDASPHGDSNLPCLGLFKTLYNCKSVRVVPPQHEIFSQGESPLSVCLICSGMVKLTSTESDGNRIIVGLRHEGSILGAVSLFLNMPYYVSAETITKSKLCYVPTDTFNKLMDSNAIFSRWIATILSKMVKSSILSISETSCLSGRQRLEKFLWKLAQAHNGVDHRKSLKIQMILKNWEVAQLLALTPQHLCRLFRQLEKEGVIMKKNGWLILPDPKKLWHPEMTSRENY